jgi:transcriptional regulator with XRE-family HTH domain
MINLKEKIDSLRKQNGFSKEQVYEAAGMTRQGFEIAIKNNTLSIDKIEKLANFFSIEPAYFFSSENEKQNNLHEKNKNENNFAQMLIDELKKRVESVERHNETLLKQLDFFQNSLKNELQALKEARQSNFQVKATTNEQGSLDRDVCGRFGFVSGGVREVEVLPSVAAGSSVV